MRLRPFIFAFEQESVPYNLAFEVCKDVKVKGAIGSGEVYLMAGVEGFCSTGNLTWLHTVSWKDTQAETGNPG